ncbi:hypothetical protein DAT35_01885 [Vitiosangium sp. GDMCC 1.1324]|nr:hypothetical protein DAT35_01885 [Vitiosangium sp. GDMCC 1.1324]
MYVKCSSCGGLYELLGSDARDMLAGQGAALPETAPVRSNRLEDDWELVREGDTLHIRWPWRSLDFWKLAVLSLCAGGFGLGGYEGWIPGKGGRPFGPLAWLFMAVGLLGGYWCIQILVNHTRIKASPQTGLEVRHGPLPSLTGSHTLAMRDIRRLYGQQRASVNKEGFTEVENELCVSLQNGSSHVLIKQGLSAEQVFFLERTLNEHLGLKEQAVPGQLEAENPGG